MNATGTTAFMYIFVGASLLLCAVSVPLIIRRIKPNPWYGFRTPKTMNDEHIWYEANAYSGRLMCFLGVILAIVTAALRFVPGLGDSVATYSSVCGGLFTIGLVVVTAMSFRFISDL